MLCEKKKKKKPLAKINRKNKPETNFLKWSSIGQRRNQVEGIKKEVRLL